MILLIRRAVAQWPIGLWFCLPLLLTACNLGNDLQMQVIEVSPSPTVIMLDSTPTTTSAATATPNPTSIPQNCSGFQSRLAMGQQAQVLPGTPNNVRQSPSVSADRDYQIPGNGRFTILEGPQCQDGYVWWRVDYQGRVGWTAEGNAADGYYIGPVPSPVNARISPSDTPPPTQDPSHGGISDLEGIANLTGEPYNEPPLAPSDTPTASEIPVQQNPDMSGLAVGQGALTASAAIVWVNNDPNTNSITRIETWLENGTPYMHWWGRCTPTDCDGGIHGGTVNADGSWFFAMDNSFSHREFTLSYQSNGDLRTIVNTRFTDNSGRQPYTTTNFFHQVG